MLATDVVTEEDVNGKRRKLIVVGLRGRNQIEGMYRQAELPVLAREHPLSRLYMQAAHEGAVSTLHRSRKRVWIIGGRLLAEAVKACCMGCRLKEKNAWSRGWGHSPTVR